MTAGPELRSRTFDEEVRRRANLLVARPARPDSLRISPGVLLRDMASLMALGGGITAGGRAKSDSGSWRGVKEDW
jgi:hypothetical protein